MKISFVATRKNSDPTERELYEMDFVLGAMGLKRSFADLGLLTVAACTPRGVDIDLVDEYIAPIDYALRADAVALSAKTSCVSRVYETAREFRKRGTRVILGGIHASLRPEEALEHVDTIVTGEAEAVWPTVVRDLEKGQLKARYDAVGFPPMAEIPPPAWRAAPHAKYLFHQLQTTRGCPFRCKFCSVPDISGQEFRFKPIERIVAELEAMPRGGNLLTKNRPLYIVDDNFISRTRFTKDLLRALVPLRKAGILPGWSAETTLNVASDDELLDLFRDAGCSTLIVGFESVTQASLEAMDKPVNFCLTYQDAIDRIHARDITVVGNFIVGFDTDARDVFKNTIDFVQKTGILYPFFSILTPMPGTKLFDDVKAQGRLFHERWDLFDTRHVVFEPRFMRPDELMDGYVWLYEQAYSGDRMLERLERRWRMRRSGGSNLIEKAFVAAYLARPMLRADRELRALYGQTLGLMARRGLHADAGEALVMLDSDDFARFLRRYRSPRWEENRRTFEDPSRVLQDTTAAGLDVKQWENKKAVLRSKNRAALPVVR